jgi:hypothetical protein
MLTRTLQPVRCALATVALVSIVAHHAAAAGSPGYAAAMKEALRLDHTKAGRDYSAKFMAALDKEEATRNAMRACMPGIPGRKTDIRSGIVFVVSADGHITLLREFDHPTALCFVRAFKAPRHVPRPPRDQWPVPYAFEFGP